MGRTFGAVDKKPRKRKHKHRKRYSENYKKYKPKEVNRDVLKLYIWKVEPMSKSGLHNWKARLRIRAKPVVYKPYLRVDVNVSEIKNNKMMGEWAIRKIANEGKYQIRAWGHATNKYKCSARKIATVTLKQSPEGLRASVEPHTRLKRYRWFYVEN